jgi:thymidine kinase
MKSLKGQWDISDLTFHIYTQLASRNTDLDVDYVYIDEVQDLTQTQIALFRYVCKNDVNIL